MAKRTKTLPKSDPAEPVDLGFLLSQVGDYSQRFFGRLIEPLGLRASHVGVLRAIHAANGSTQRELGERLGIFPSNLVKLVDELQSRALVERTQREGDRRSYRLILTADGERTLREIVTKVQEHQNVLCSLLSSAERQELRRLLRRIADEQGLRPGVHPELTEAKQDDLKQDDPRKTIKRSNK